MNDKTQRDKDWATAKSLVREWLMEKGIALTGVHGEASRSTVNRFKLDLQRRVVSALTTAREQAIADERERCAGIAQSFGVAFYKETQVQVSRSPQEVKQLIFGQDLAKKIGAAIRRDDTGEEGS